MNKKEPPRPAAARAEEKFGDAARAAHADGKNGFRARNAHIQPPLRPAGSTAENSFAARPRGGELMSEGTKGTK